MQIRHFCSLSSNSPEMNTMKLYHLVKRKKKTTKNYYFSVPTWAHKTDVAYKLSKSTVWKRAIRYGKTQLFERTHIE